MKRRIFFVIAFLFFFLPSISEAATLSLSPSSGNYSIGSTFNVSVLLDTKGQAINAIEVGLSFPPDMLQVVSPSTGQSVIGVWTATPKFDNTNGRIELQGGIPGGITSSNALVSTFTFRVKSVGDGTIKFLDKTKVLQNNGLGTNVLEQTSNANYKFKLPAPAGPQVVSDTNPDQATWYPNKTVSLKFINEPAGVLGYSYIMSDDPTTIPDNISEGTKPSVSYTNVADGIHYFHVKSLRGTWGGTTHFAIKVDSTPPAEFEIEVIPSARTSVRQPVLQFLTTDALSSIGHYDLKIIPLSLKSDDNNSAGLFIEAISPYILSPLELGSYDVIVRAYDISGNYREITKRLHITTPFFSFITDTGLKIAGFIIPWTWLWIILILILLLLGYLAYRVKVWRSEVHTAHREMALPDNIASQLQELKQYREKYGAKALVLIFLISSLFGFSSMTEAQTQQIAPPLITNISKNISDGEIFYISGRTNFTKEKVVIYLQNLGSGETFSQDIESDDKGDWFYRHSTFLSPGNYLLWTQSKIGEELSPPSPQVTMTVNRTAVQFGGGRLSYEAIYLFTIIILLVLMAGLATFIIYHLYHGRKKHMEFQKDIKNAEESIKRGFAVLKHDIEAELSIINKVKMNALLSEEEKEKEAQLLSDLQSIEERIGREIWEISQEA